MLNQFHIAPIRSMKAEASKMESDEYQDRKAVLMDVR